MTFEHDEIDTQAGTETAVQLYLRNWGECRMTYRLLPGRVPENWVEIYPGQILVDPGGEVAVTVRIKVPSDAPVAHHIIIIHAIDAFTELECGHTMLKLQVKASHASPSSPFASPAVEKPVMGPPISVEKLLLSLAPASQSSAGAAVYALSVTNPHTRAIELNLRATDASNWLAIVIDPPYLVLGPHQQGTARVQVTPISPLPDKTIERPCTFVVSACTMDGTEGSTQGILLQTHPPSSTRASVWVGGALGAISPILVCFVLSNIYAVRGVAPVAPALPTGTAMPANARPITLVLTVPPRASSSPRTSTPRSTETVPPRATPTEASIGLEAATPSAVPLPPFAITNLVTLVDPATRSECPTSFDFSAQIIANGPGAATYYWEFSDGGTTTPAAVTFKQRGRRSFKPK